MGGSVVGLDWWVGEYTRKNPQTCYSLMHLQAWYTYDIIAPLSVCYPMIHHFLFYRQCLPRELRRNDPLWSNYGKMPLQGPGSFGRNVWKWWEYITTIYGDIYIFDIETVMHHPPPVPLFSPVLKQDAWPPLPTPLVVRQLNAAVVQLLTSIKWTSLVFF